MSRLAQRYLKARIRHFRPWGARQKCCQVIATTTDNRKWQCGRQNRKYLYLWNRDIYDRNSKGKSGVFDHAELEETVPGRLQQRLKTGNGNINVYGTILLFPAVYHCRNNLATHISSSSSKMPDLPLEFRRYLT